MSIPQQFILFLRSALAAALLLRPARRAAAPPRRPEAAPTLGAFGLLAYQGEPHRR